MTELADIDLKNPDLLARNPVLQQLVGPPAAGKGSKWHNKPATDLSGETYGSGREAEDARKFVQAVMAGEYLAYHHHLKVKLPGGVIMELDHVLINNKLQVEVFDTKLFDEKKQKFICTDKWRTKQRVFEDVFGIKIQLI
ncbi:MAG: hypothetical protein PHI12_11350 [Dehalococcoidales bacterium]|nr:hypothetical protein [Dehalococcoidales bacterium]